MEIIQDYYTISVSAFVMLSCLECPWRQSQAGEVPWEWSHKCVHPPAQGLASAKADSVVC